MSEVPSPNKKMKTEHANVDNVVIAAPPDPYYPEAGIQKAINAFRDGPIRIPKPSADFHKLNVNNLIPLSLQRLHFVLLNHPTAYTFPTEDWILGSNAHSVFSRPSDNDVSPQDFEGWDGSYHILDADIQDATGKLFSTRIVYNEGDVEANPGFWGKVFDRKTKSVMANLTCPGYNLAKIESLPHVRNSFANHDEITALEPYLQHHERYPDKVEKGDHFAYLIGLAIEASRSFPSTIYVQDHAHLKLLERLKLSLLGKSAATNPASSVICQHGPSQDLIAEFLVGNDYFPLSSSESIVEENSSSFNFVTRRISALLMATYWWRQNDRTSAMRALKAFKRRVSGADSDAWFVFNYSKCFLINDQQQNNGKDDIEIDFNNEQSAEEFLNGRAKALTLGWTEDEAFFASVIPHAERLEESQRIDEAPQEDELSHGDY